MDKKKFIGIIIALIIIGLCSYFFYYTKTPTYSLNLIKDSIQKHDVATFKKHVDLDSLISRGYDDLMAVSMNDLKDNSLGAGFAKGLIEMMKPTITNALKDGALRAVENGKWEDVPSNGQTDTSSVKSEEIADRAGIKSASFKGIEYTKKDGKTAIVGIKINEPSLEKDYILDIKMRELDDGTWQIVEISNLKDYLTELDKVKKIALKKYVDQTNTITAKYNKDLAQIQSTYTQNSPEFFNKYLENIQACRAELATISVPPAATELVNVRNKFYDTAERQSKTALEILAGNKTPEKIREYNELSNTTRNLGQKRDNILNSVKDIQE